MGIAIFIVLGVIGLFFAAIYIFAAVDSFVSQLSRPADDTAALKRKKQSAGIKKILFNLFLVVTLSGLAFILFYLSSELIGEHIPKKPIDRDVKLRAALFGYLKDKAENTSGEKANQADEATLNPEISSLEKTFMPSTSVNLAETQEKEMDAKPIRAESTSFPVTVTGSKKGDIFIVASYDQVKDGAFLKSDLFRLVQRPSKKAQTVKIEVRMPPLNKRYIIQLPTLLNGHIIPATAADDSYILSENGSMEALKDTGPFNLIYFIKKYDRLPEAHFEQTRDAWVQKEHKDIPNEITNIFKSVKDRSDFVKLGSVAVILNTYFAYQAGIEEVVLQKGKTWNSLLSDMTRSGNKLLCDCDVLCMFASVYLRLLDLHPILLVGYINQSDSETFIPPEKMHSTIYVKSDNEWVLFDPTLFTTSFNPAQSAHEADEKQPPSDQGPYGEASSENGSMGIKVNDVVASDSEIKYFRLPEDMMVRFQYADDRRIGLTPAQYIADLLLTDNENMPRHADKTKKYAWTGDSLIKISVILYILTMIFVKSFLLAKENSKKVFPLSRSRLALYMVSLCIILLSLFIRQNGIYSSFWKSSGLLSNVGAFICAGAGIISTLSAVSFVIEIKGAPEVSGKILRIVIENIYLAAGLLFGIGALFYSPSEIVFIAFLVMAMIFLPRAIILAERLR